MSGDSGCICGGVHNRVMKPYKNNNEFADRLTTCIDLVGGKRAMATSALISEAQLFRYVSGETALTADRLIDIAKAAQVNPSWLLTGEGEMSTLVSVERRPIFRSSLMVQLIQVFEELLIEFEKTFSPRQRSRAITYIYNALRHEERRRGIEFTLQKFDMLKYINFLSELRTEEELEILIQGFEYIEYFQSDLSHDDVNQLLTTWCNIIVRGMKGYYSSYAGKMYFERKSDGNLASDKVIELQNLVIDLYSLTGKNDLDWLDLGCGNGQHLAHLAKHMPNIKIKGLELSQLGYNICKELMDSERLPQNSISMGDMRKLPYGTQSFDVVFSHLSMQGLPYLPGTNLGLEEVKDEIYRVLRPGGVAVIVMPEGNGRDYLMPRQYMNLASLKALIGDQFDLVRHMTKVAPSHQSIQNGGANTDRMKIVYDSVFWGIIQKK